MESFKVQMVIKLSAMLLLKVHLCFNNAINNDYIHGIIFAAPAF